MKTLKKKELNEREKKLPWKVRVKDEKRSRSKTERDREQKNHANRKEGKGIRGISGT